jgi:hypothetical protein
MTGSSNVPMHFDEKNQQEIKSGFEGVSGMVSKFANPATHLLSGPQASTLVLKEYNIIHTIG